MATKGLTLSDANQYPRMLEGIVPEKVVRLGEGSLLYRFAHSKLSGPRRVASAWWWTDDAFEKIQKFMAIDPANAGEIARMQAGVKYEWSAVDTLITAVVGKEIDAFQGPGKQQFERRAGRAPILFIPPADLFQTFIPGLVDPRTGLLNATGKSVILKLDEQSVPSFDDLGIRKLKAARGRAVYLIGNPRVH